MTRPILVALLALGLDGECVTGDDPQDILDEMCEADGQDAPVLKVEGPGGKMKCREALDALDECPVSLPDGCR